MLGPLSRHDRYGQWKSKEFSNSTWVLGSDQLSDEQELVNRLARQQPWEEQPEYADMPYRPPHRCCLTEWDSADDETLHYIGHLKGEIPAHIEDTEEMMRKLEYELKRKTMTDEQAAKEQEQDMVRMTTERMAILRALEKAGGAVEDPGGSATAKLAALVNRKPENLRPFTGILSRMEDEGLIVREKPTPTSKRTIRIALPNDDEFSELTDALRVLGGSVEQNGEDAAALLRGAMQYDGGKRAFRDLLSRADREGVIHVDRDGNRILSISLATGSDDVVTVTEHQTEQDNDNVTATALTEDRESHAFGIMDLSDAVQDDGDLQKLSLLLLDEVIRRATEPQGVSETEIEIAVEKRTIDIQAQLDKAAQVVTDRLNQLDEAEHRIKELEANVIAGETQLKNARKEIADLSKELNRRPLGPKVDEILRPDSKNRLEQFKKLMTEKPTRK